MGAFILLWNNSEDFRNFWLGLWENVQAAFSAAWEAILNFFTATIPEAWNSFVAFFTETIPNFVANIGDWFGKLPKLLNAVLKLALEQIIQWGADLWNFASTEVPKFVSQVITFFSELPGKIWTWLCDAANKVGIFFANLISPGISKASEFVSSVINFIKELPNKIWNGIVGAVSAVVNWGGQLLSAGINAAQNLVSGIWNTVCELPGKMLNIGSDLVRGLWNGISNVTGWVLDKIKGFGNSILNGIKSFFGIASPSKLFEEQIGKNLALGVGEGFENSMKNVSKQMQNSIPTDFEIDMNTAINYVNSGANFESNSLKNKPLNGLSTELSVIYQKETEVLERLLDETHELNGSLCGKIVKALVDGVSLRFNDREIARLVRRYA